MKFTGRVISCPLCGNGPERQEVVSTVDRRGEPLRTVLCGGCGLVFSNPMPTGEEVTRFYRDDYRQEYKGVAEPKAKHIYRATNAALDRYQAAAEFYEPGGRYLDFGAGGGEYLYLLKRKGLDAEGIEPNVGYAQFAIKEYGVKISVGPFETANVPAGQFDLVSSFHVFEHLIDPAGAFAKAALWLKPGGRLYLEVPNVNAADQTFRSRFHFAHVFQYSPATLIALAAKSGFACERVLIGGQAGVVRIVFRKGDGPVAVPMPDAEQIAETRNLLRSRPRFGQRWFRRNAAKLFNRFREKRMLKGLAGRAVADGAMESRG